MCIYMHSEKKLDRNNLVIQHDVLNKSWKHYSTKPQLYGHFPSISQTTQVRRTRHVGVARRKSKATFSTGLPYMNTPVLTDKQRPIFINNVWTADAFRGTCQERWTIEMDCQRKSRTSVLSARLDVGHIRTDVYTYIYIERGRERERCGVWIAS